MQLDIIERLAALNLLPTIEGSITTLRAAREIAAKIGFSAEELNEWEIIQNGGQVSIKRGLDLDSTFREIPLSDLELELLAKPLRALSDKGGLRQQDMTLFEKLVEKKSSPVPTAPVVL